MVGGAAAHSCNPEQVRPGFHSPEAGQATKEYYSELREFLSASQEFLKRNLNNSQIQAGIHLEFQVYIMGLIIQKHPEFRSKS